jgi:hypothetical protein
VTSSFISRQLTVKLVLRLARIAVIRKAHKEARAIEARRAGLPFPIGTTMSTSERRWSQGAAALDARALYAPQARPTTVRQTSQNDVGLPSYCEWPRSIRGSKGGSIAKRPLPLVIQPTLVSKFPKPCTTLQLSDRPLPTPHPLHQ